MADNVQTREKSTPVNQPHRVRFYWAMGAAALSLALVGYFDWVTNWKVSLSFFYLIPILIAFLFGGRTIGILACFLADGTALTEHLLEQVDTETAVWNACMRLGLYLLIVILFDMVLRGRQKIRDLQDHLGGF